MKILRLVAFIALGALSTIFLIWGFSVPRYQIRLQPLSWVGETLVEGAASEIDSRFLRLEFPPRLRAGDPGIIRLKLLIDEASQVAILEENRPDTHHIMAEARLELTGMQVNPAGLASQPLRPGQELDFLWQVRSSAVGIATGTVWFYMRFVPLTGGLEQVQALSAQKIEIETVHFLGLGAQTVRWLGGVGLVFSVGVGLPFLEDLLKRLWSNIRLRAGQIP